MLLAERPQTYSTHISLSRLCYQTRLVRKTSTAAGHLMKKILWTAEARGKGCLRRVAKLSITCCGACFRLGVSLSVWFVPHTKSPPTCFRKGCAVILGFHGTSTSNSKGFLLLHAWSAMLIVHADARVTGTTAKLHALLSRSAAHSWALGPGNK